MFAFIVEHEEKGTSATWHSEDDTVHFGIQFQADGIVVLLFSAGAWLGQHVLFKGFA